MPRSVTFIRSGGAGRTGGKDDRRSFARPRSAYLYRASRKAKDKACLLGPNRIFCRLSARPQGPARIAIQSPEGGRRYLVARASATGSPAATARWTIERLGNAVEIA